MHQRRRRAKAVVKQPIRIDKMIIPHWDSVGMGDANPIWLAGEHTSRPGVAPVAATGVTQKNRKLPISPATGVYPIVVATFVPAATLLLGLRTQRKVDAPCTSALASV